MPTMRERFTTVASELLDTDPRAAVVLADIGVGNFGANGALDRHPDRIVNVGIREQLMIGVGAGMALEGMRPIIHTYAPFLVERAYEQIKLDLGHQDVGAVLVSVGASYDASSSGRTHHAPADVALLAALGGWEIHVPGHPDEVEYALRRAVAASGRAYIRLAADMNQQAAARSGLRMTVMKRGSSAAPTVVAVGPMLDRVIAATEDRDVTVAYAATVRPFDVGTLRRVASGPEVILVEPYLAGTSTAVVSDALSDRPRRILALGIRNTELRRYGSRHQHDASHGLDIRGIRAAIDDFVGVTPCAGRYVA